MTAALVEAVVGVVLLLAVVLAAVRIVREYQRAAVSRAETRKQAKILSAEGDRQAAILRAEGFALALSKIFEVAHTVDANTMRLQYLDALRQIGSSDATKIVVPLELGDLDGDVHKRAKS